MLRVLAVTNLYPTRHSPTSGTFIEQQIEGLRRIGVTVDILFCDRGHGGKKVYVGLRRQLHNRLGAFKPHIIHVMYGGVMARKVTTAVRHTPVIVSFCGTDLLGEPLVPIYSRLIRQYGVWASYKAARLASAIIVKAKNLQSALPSDIDASKVHVIPNGVNLDRFKPMDRERARCILGWPSDTAVVLFVTVAGHPRKRLGLAMEAFNRMNVCDFKTQFHVMQGVPHDQVPLWLNASDVLLLTSVHEGGVNIVKEAMACNLPIVSVDVGDVRERLLGVRSSMIVDEDPEMLARAMRQILCRHERSDGRSHLSDLTITKVARRLIEVYSTAIDRHCRCQPAA
jgi:glycosyltransferase involved in cell wall biosynthesis